MLPFHISLHVKPKEFQPGPLFKIDAQLIPTLAILPHQLSQHFDITFEDAISHLEKLPRMFCELDGSFVWVGETPESISWQVDGQLMDGHEKLHYVELKGRCQFDAIETLATTLIQKKQPLVVQLVQQAVFIDLELLRCFLMPASPGNSSNTSTN